MLFLQTQYYLHNFTVNLKLISNKKFVAKKKKKGAVRMKMVKKLGEWEIDYHVIFYSLFGSQESF